VYLLAQETGFNIEYVLWDISLCVLRQFYGTSLWLKGVKLRRPTSDIDREQIAKLLNI
jgi:hypothetical protein